MPMVPPGRRPLPHIPPGSTPLREFAGAVAQALTLPNEDTTGTELRYLRAGRQRARAVLYAARKIVADRGIEEDPRDVAVVIEDLREAVEMLPPPVPNHIPQPGDGE
jgi:hypothetical protein